MKKTLAVGLRIHEDCILFPSSENLGGMVLFLIGICLFVVFGLGLPILLLLTAVWYTYELFMSFSFLGLMRFAANWAIISLGIFFLARNLRNSWQPRVFAGTILNVLLLGRARLMIRKEQQVDGLILSMERQLPFGLVWRQKTLPLSDLGPVAVWRSQRSWGEFPILNVSCNVPTPILSGNADSTAFARTLQRWKEEAGVASSSNRVKARKLRLSPEGKTRPSSAAAFTADGRVLAACGWDGKIRFWQLPGGEVLHEIEGPSPHSVSIALSRDGKKLCCVGWFSPVRLFEVANRKLLMEKDYARDCHVHNTVHGLNLASFSPDGNLLAAPMLIGKRSLGLVNLEGGEPVVATLTTNEGRIWSTTFSPDGKTLACGTGKSVELWDIAERKVSTILRGHGKEVVSLAFSPDGRILASGSWDGTVRLWNLADGQPIDTLRGFYVAYSAGALAFSSDGGRLAFATQGSTGEISIWDITERRTIATFGEEMSFVLRVIFGPDGKTLTTVSHDSVVMTWDLP